jgi:hypothetical protein
MTITDQVENILRASKQARNSDTELQIIYMQKFGLNLTDHQVELFRNMPSLETIRRVRQKIQEQGKYPADQAVRGERKRKALVMQQTAPSAKPHNIEKTLGYRIRPWGKG